MRSNHLVSLALVILTLSFFVAICFAAEPNSQDQSAQLLEAVEWEPCGYYCGALNHPATEYCLHVNGQALVGERRGFLWLGESDAASVRNFAGKQVSIRFNASAIWIERSDSSPVKIERGSTFEGFKDADCLIEVHKPKLALAAAAKRPNNIPEDVIALAGTQSVDQQYRAVFIWTKCSMSADTTTVNCSKWYPNGESKGIDRYCARTTAGASIPTNFEVDELISSEGRLVLKGGATVARDDRGRVNDGLMRPTEACYQAGPDR